MSDYTLEQLEGKIKCDCGCKYWEQREHSGRIFCVDCGQQSPRKPEINKSMVKSNLRYAERLIKEIRSQLGYNAAPDDPRLGVDIDLETLEEMARDLMGSVATFSEYVVERGGSV